MKRVLHIAESFATGVLSFLVDLTRLQVEHYEVYILWGQRPLTPPDVDRLFDPRVRLARIRSFCGAMGTVVNPAAYVEVRRWYKEIQPDIVHLHSSAAGFVGRWAVPCSRVRVCYTPHGYSFLSGNGSALRRALFRLAERAAACRRATTVACSPGEYAEAQRLTNNCVLVNNGINTDLLEPHVRSLQAISRPIRICTSGRILTQKNPRLFNEIARILPEAQFTWIGDGELRGELTAENIRVTGWIDREETPEWVNQSDFYILTSSWEGLPISLLEAMYLKRVCLVSDVIGNRDVVSSGHNGIICHGADDYASAIRRIADCPAEGIRLAEAAHQDVADHYSIAPMARAYDEVYNK